MKDFLFFRRMIMPWLITILFWIGSVTSILFGIYCLTTRQWPAAFVSLLLGPLGLRLICEWFILAFSINETLTDIKQSLVTGEKS